MANARDRTPRCRVSAVLHTPMRDTLRNICHRDLWGRGAVTLHHIGTCGTAELLNCHRHLWETWSPNSATRRNVLHCVTLTVIGTFNDVEPKLCTTTERAALRNFRCHRRLWETWSPASAPRRNVLRCVTSTEPCLCTTTERAALRNVNCHRRLW